VSEGILWEFENRVLSFPGHNSPWKQILRFPESPLVFSMGKMSPSFLRTTLDPAGILGFSKVVRRVSLRDRESRFSRFQAVIPRDSHLFLSPFRS
jgi:hypothetical protein